MKISLKRNHCSALTCFVTKVFGTCNISSECDEEKTKVDTLDFRLEVVG